MASTSVGKGLQVRLDDCTYILGRGPTRRLSRSGKSESSAALGWDFYEPFKACSPSTGQRRGPSPRRCDHGRSFWRYCGVAWTRERAEGYAVTAGGASCRARVLRLSARTSKPVTIRESCMTTPALRTPVPASEQDGEALAARSRRHGMGFFHRAAAGVGLRRRRG